MTDLIIDAEFRDLLPPLSDEKRKQLEENLLHDGIQDALKIWNGILIDGHNRYEIAQRHNLEFTTVEMHFDTRDDVKIWIADNQFGRRDLTTYERAVLALKLKPVFAAKAKERMTEGTNQYTSPVKISCQGSEELPPPKPVREQKTDYQVAQKAGVSEDTIRKVEKIEEQATPEIKDALRTGDLSINAAYKGVKAGATTVEEVQQAKKPHVTFNRGNNERYTPADIIEDARKVLGNIDLDPASSELANETVKATKIYTAEDDGLLHDWFGNIWLNPPYSKDLLVKFADKLVASKFNQAIVLVINSTETKWFATLISKASAIVFPTGRVICQTPIKKLGTSSPLQGSALIYFGDNPKSFLDIFRPRGWGTCLQLSAEKEL